MSVDQTWRFDAMLSPQERETLLAAARAEGIACEVRAVDRFGSTYVSASVPDARAGQEFAARHHASAAYDPPVIALAIEPQNANALPALFEALGGAGAPAGVTGCEIRERALILEVALSVSPWRLVRAVIDAELARFASTRTTTLLSPLPPALQAQVAADGLDCPEIAPARVIEVLIDADR